MERIYRDLRAKKRLFICSDCCAFTETLALDLKKRFPDIKTKIKIYNANTPKDGTLKDVNTTWKQYHVLIVSPIVLYGINYSNRDHIDVVYGHYETIILPSAIIQQIRRVRHVK